MPRLFRNFLIAAVAIGSAAVARGQTIKVPLSLDQAAFFYRTYPTYATNTPPSINWLSGRGVPISTNSLDAGSDGRGPTLGQQISYGTNSPTASPSPGQFRGVVGFGAVPVQGSTVLNTNLNFAQNTDTLDWPRLKGSGGNVLAVLRASQVGAPYLSRLSAIPFGSVIPVPATDEAGAPLTNTPNYWFAAPFAGGVTNLPYYYSPYANAVFATQPGQVTIIWQKSVPASAPPTNLPANVGVLPASGNYYILYTNTYLVSGEPVKVPQRMFWTEGTRAALGHQVPVPSSLAVNVIYNDFFPRDVAAPGDTSLGVLATNATHTLWWDTSSSIHALRADNAVGRVFVEILGARNGDGTVPFLGFELVDVLSDPAPTDVNVELGTRIPAYQDRRDDSNLTVSPLPNEDQFYYSQTIPNTQKVNLYATRETLNLNDFEAYWLVTGVAGIQWPLLYNRYHEYWPADPGEYVHYVRPLVATATEAARTGVQLPANEAPSIAYQDALDVGRASVSASGLFYTFLDVAHPVHRTLLQFISGNNVAYERVFSWLDAGLKDNSLLTGSVATSLSYWNAGNPGFQFPDLSQVPYVITNTVNVGDRITAPGGELGSGGTNYLAGYIIQARGNSFNPGAYLDPFVAGFTNANQGAIIPVNAIPGSNVLEVLWFRSDNANAAQGFQSSYWPVVLGHYVLQWPSGKPEIILASNQGSGPLDASLAQGAIYRQPDSSLPGYNPNEEHAMLVGGQVYALRDDLNDTSPGTYTSDPFVLLDYVASDGRPAMAMFYVRREAPELGRVFDYVVEAGSVLQAPMPLPLMEPPLEGVGASARNYNSEPPVNSGDLPAGFGNLPGGSPLAEYGRFTHEDRKREFWVYRGLHGGLPPLLMGAYNAANNSFDALPAATAVLNQPFTYYLHHSRRLDSLTVTATGLPAGLGITPMPNHAGFAITGVPLATGVSSCSLTTTDTGDGSTVTRALSLTVVGNGSVVAEGPLVISSTNQYSGQPLITSNRPPFLALAPTPTNSFTMRFYYKNRDVFDWPRGTNPGVGAIVPYLRPMGSAGDPASKATPSLDIVYRPVWPSLVNGQPLPTLQSGQTLTIPVNGLAAVRGQSSVRVLYHQSLATNDVTGSNTSVVLFDPTVRKTSRLPAQHLTQLPVGVNATLYQGRYYFPNLPPNLVNRVYFDPAGTNLVLEGQFVAETVGESYLLLNVLAGADLAAVNGLCPVADRDYNAWLAVVANLSAPLYTFHEAPNTPGSYVVDTNQTLTRVVGDLVAITSSEQQVDSYALSANGPGLGYISYIVGDTINPTHAAEPVTVYIAQVATGTGLRPGLYPGQLKVIEDPNPLSESISFQHTDDLAGQSARYQYDWRIAPPVDGQPPVADPSNWTQLTSMAFDLNHYTLGAATGIQSLGDNYVALRFRETGPLANPANTNWSAWTAPVLAEGYIKRVLAGINPFDQRTKDLFNNPVNTTASIISQAGHRWEGDVALNASTISNSGLIEIYETLLHRGEALSINAGYNYGPANDALLLAAGYLSDLYSYVANDALADAYNPTIGIGTADKTYGNIATALFAFQGQEPSLLEEELALLRGRDDSLSPGVALAPVYNRLWWNYTRGLDAGEVIYALNYNILDQNNDGVVNATDAAILYPMGHGDAYGHYLTALGNYYSLLMNPNFDWVPQIETVSVLGAAVSVNYEHERKFAATSAALAKTGLQVFDLTWRRDYQPGSSGGWEYFESSHPNPQRLYLDGDATNAVTGYWGLDYWAARTAQGAYLNWVVGNAILPPVDPDPSHQGIQKVDRTTVPELNELPQTMTQLQVEMGNAEAGFTPFDLPQNAIPFDINPQLVTGANPQTHFEQVYERAVATLNNAVVAFDDAQGVTQLMRSEEDSLANFQAAVVAQELAYNNQLIEIYGTPYPDDMGPGKTYPQDYNGPDLIHFTYAETPDANTYGVLPDPTQTKTYYLDLQHLPSDWSTMMYSNFNFIVRSTAPGYQTDRTLSVPFVVGPDGFFDKPSDWVGQRASPGAIQQAISPIVAAQNAVRDAARGAEGDKATLDKSIAVFNAQVDAWRVQLGLADTIQVLNTLKSQADTAYNIFKVWNTLEQKFAANTYNLTKDGVPEWIILGTADGSDAGKVFKSIFLEGAVASQELLTTADATTYTAYQVAVDALQTSINGFNIGIAQSQFDMNVKNAALALTDKIKILKTDLVTINQKLRVQSDAQQAYQALVAKGQRLQQERLTYRQHAAALVQGYRTRDAAFRVFQNEKLARYKTLFDLAAKYAYLAAQAYDYETGLLGTSQGQDFLNRLISARALGVVHNGQPQYTGSTTGDPGLSSALAELKADWDVVKGRLGFNNPDGYGTTVSLRSENYRILSNTNGDNAWVQLLQQSRLADLRNDPDVKRRCLQLDDGSGVAVPGIVLTFGTVITNTLNLFGNPLAAGDHYFSSSSFATKIYAAGVCFDGYVGMDNPSTSGSGSVPDPRSDPNALAATPYIYLIPVGQDSMRSPPLGDTSTIRTFTVDDVALPLPFDVSAADFSSTLFYTAANSLSEPLFAERGHQAFRPVSTTSVFNPSIYGATGALQPSQYTNKRLIGRSIWNSQWKLVIPGRSLLADPNQGLDLFIQTIKDIHLYFITYSYSGN